MASWPRVLAPPAAAFGAVMVVGDFDFEGWQRVVQFGGALALTITAWWVLLAKIWAPYKVKRDKARADAAAKLVKEKAEAEATRVEQIALIVRREIERSGLNRAIEAIVRCVEQLAAVDDDITDLLMINTGRAVLLNDVMRVLYHSLKIPAPPFIDDDDSWEKVLAKEVRERVSVRRKVRAQNEPYPPRTTPPLPGGRRRGDPPLPTHGSEV